MKVSGKYCCEYIVYTRNKVDKLDSMIKIPLCLGKTPMRLFSFRHNKNKVRDIFFSSAQKFVTKGQLKIFHRDAQERRV